MNGIWEDYRRAKNTRCDYQEENAELTALRCALEDVIVELKDDGGWIDSPVRQEAIAGIERALAAGKAMRAEQMALHARQESRDPNGIPWRNECLA